jgi:hypothetical protein
MTEETENEKGLEDRWESAESVGVQGKKGRKEPQ